MSAALHVWRRELGVALDSAVAWVACILFVVTLHGAFFFLGYPIGDRSLPGFWAGRVASLDTLFAWLPALFCVLAPAITMGAWAEERRSGTDELLLTQPVSLRSIVVGKFLAAWCLLGGITTIAVVPVAAVVASLGPLDWSASVGGLCGAWLLAAVCVAIGLLASSLSQEQLVAFLTATVALAILWSAALFVRVVPPGFADVVWYASPSLHFLESSARGVFDLRDPIYHGLFCAGALLLTVTVVEGRRWR